MTAAGLPTGWSIELDAAARRTDGGRTLIGGSPLRILRLTDAGARWLDRAGRGERLGAAPGPRRLARRLVDAGLAHPLPSRDDRPPAAGVAVVLPVRDAPEGLRRTLESLDPVATAQVVVVDDGSQDPRAIERAVERAGVSATLLRNRHPLGPAAARERGWRSTAEAFVAFLDADVEAEPGWLPPLLDHLGDPAVAAVAPRVTAAPASAPPGLAAYEAVRSPLDLGPAPALVRPGSRVPYVPTAALVVRRRALESVGGFDPGLRVGEDVDLVWRLHQDGWRVRYEPSATVRHSCRPDLAGWIGQRVAYGTSAALLARRHGRAVAPLGISGWSALAWSAVVAGWPGAAVGIGAGTAAALAPKLRGLDHPRREALRIAGTGHLWAGRAVAEALRRPWWPLAAAVAAGHRRSRPALLAAAVAPALLEWRERRPALDPARFAALRLLDDLAYGTGVWIGCLRERSIAALLPSFSGPTPPPAP